MATIEEKERFDQQMTAINDMRNHMEHKINRDYQTSKESALILSSVYYQQAVLEIGTMTELMRNYLNTVGWMRTSPRMDIRRNWDL